MALYGGKDKGYSHKINGKSCGYALSFPPYNAIMHCDNFSIDIVYCIGVSIKNAGIGKDFFSNSCPQVKLKQAT